VETEVLRTFARVNRFPVLLEEIETLVRRAGGEERP